MARSSSYRVLETQDADASIESPFKPHAAQGLQGAVGKLQFFFGSCLPVAQIAGGALSVAFCTAGVVQQLAPLAAELEVRREFDYASTALPLAVPLAQVLLGSATARLSELATGVDTDERHCGTAVLGLSGMILGCVAMASAPEIYGAEALSPSDLDKSAGRQRFAVVIFGLGVLSLSVARVCTLLGLYARAAEAVALERLPLIFVAASFAAQVGDVAGDHFANTRWGSLQNYPGLVAGLSSAACEAESACFQVRPALLVAVSLLLASSWCTALRSPCLAGARRGTNAGDGRGLDTEVAQAKLAPSGAAMMEQVMEERGTRTVLICSLLAWAAWSTVEIYCTTFVGQELRLEGESRTLLGRARLAMLCLGFLTALLIPVLFEALSGFGVWLCGNTLLASVLLFSLVVHEMPSGSLVMAWVASFGPANVILMAVPYAIAARRARARALPVSASMAAVTTAMAGARMFWAWAGDAIEEIFGTNVAMFVIGAACAIWAAAACSQAIMCDRDEFKITKLTLDALGVGNGFPEAS